MTEEIKTVESPIVPDNTSYAGVLTKGKNVTVLGDSMISALRSPLVEMLFTSFSGAYMSKQCTIVIDYLLYCDLLHFTYKWGCKQVNWVTDSFLLATCEL